MRVDLHCHTNHSPDSTTPPRVLVERAREAGLDRVAVTDHGAITGALEARSLDPERVIVGQEIRCLDRTEIIGLFLRERIPERLPLDETVARIRDQGGLVYAPHPFAYLTRPRWRGLRATWVADVIEGFNSRAFWPAWNRRARQTARRRRLPLAAGSDAHFPWEIGQAYTEMPAFRTVEEFRASLEEARPVGLALSSPAVHVASALLKATAPLRPSPKPSRRPSPEPALWPSSKPSPRPSPKPSPRPSSPEVALPGSTG